MAPIEYFGTPKSSATEQVQIDTEVDALIVSEQRVSPANQAIVDENEWVAAQARDASVCSTPGGRSAPPWRLCPTPGRLTLA